MFPKGPGKIAVVPETREPAYLLQCFTGMLQCFRRQQHPSFSEVSVERGFVKQLKTSLQFVAAYACLPGQVANAMVHPQIPVYHFPDLLYCCNIKTGKRHKIVLQYKNPIQLYSFWLNCI